jgi:1-acyl-sn-glycerol-3-phosphate acyltransferase
VWSPRGRRPFIALGGVQFLLSRWFRAEMEGLELLPRDRPVIVVAKHPRTSVYAETLLLLAHTCRERGSPPFRVMEERGSSSDPVACRRSHLGAIPASDDAALEALARGESLLVFPGGARELHGPRDAIQWRGRRRYARLAALTGTPVVPLAILGADRQHPWKLQLGPRTVLWLPLLPLPVKLVYRFGAPMKPPPAADTASVAAFSEAVAHATRRLLAPRRARRADPTALPAGPAVEG